MDGYLKSNGPWGEKIVRLLWEGALERRGQRKEEDGFIGNGGGCMA